VLPKLRKVKKVENGAFNFSVIGKRENEFFSVRENNSVLRVFLKRLVARVKGYCLQVSIYSLRFSAWKVTSNDYVLVLAFYLNDYCRALNGFFNRFCN
jgi:hypothetical protein